MSTLSHVVSLCTCSLSVTREAVHILSSLFLLSLLSCSSPCTAHELYVEAMDRRDAHPDMLFQPQPYQFLHRFLAYGERLSLLVFIFSFLACVCRAVGPGAFRERQSEASPGPPQGLDPSVSSAPSFARVRLPDDWPACPDWRDHGHLQLRLDRHRARNEGNLGQYLPWCRTC